MHVVVLQGGIVKFQIQKFNQNIFIDKNKFAFRIYVSFSFLLALGFILS